MKKASASAIAEYESRTESYITGLKICAEDDVQAIVVKVEVVQVPAVVEYVPVLRLIPSTYIS